MSDSSIISEIIHQFFEVGKTKNLAPLRGLQFDDKKFSSYSDVPPLDLKDYATTIALQELRFVSISDYYYDLSKIRIDIFGTCSVATFIVKQSGVLVDNYSFRGQTISIKSRATLVFVKFERWKIVHIHLTQISD